MKKLIAIALTLTALTSASGVFSNSSKDELLKINDQIVAKKQQVTDLQKQIKASEDKIASLRNSEDNLQNEIAILENQITKNGLDIQKTQAQIEETTLEVQELDRQLSDLEERVAADRGTLGDLIRQLSREDDRSALMSFFLADNLSAIFARAKSVSDLQGELLSTVKRLQEAKADTENKRAEKATKNEDLRKQKDVLQIETVKLQDARESKQQLIDQTRNNENKYRSLVDELRSEATDVSNDLASLEAQVRQRIAANDRFPTGDVILSWPVPSHKITASFHDADYPFRRIMEHPGIDISSTPQGTPVRAAAPGYVLKVRDAGYGYSYIILLHQNGISTVYGHLSRLTATEESYVDRGDVIGYSGGMPGTRGAGPMTTGPHLHFETRVNGIPADPLDYLVN